MRGALTSCVYRSPKNTGLTGSGRWTWRALLSTGDYIILGEVAGEITPETVQAVVESHWPDAFAVRLFKDNTDGPLPHYRLEGV